MTHIGGEPVEDLFALVNGHGRSSR
jgi:hypothetical protein